MQTLKWEYYPLVAQNTLTRAFIEELAQVRRSPSTVDNYSRDLEDFLQALVEVPFPAVLEADETLIARYLDSLWNRPARRGSGHKLSREHVTFLEHDTSSREYGSTLLRLVHSGPKAP